MSVFQIALRSIVQRGVASSLTSLSMALGVMLVVIVLSLHGLVAESFNANSSVGYNMIIGARGGSMQLALNSVYYLSKPLETIPYEYLLAFKPQDVREREIKDSIVYRTREASWNAMEIQSMGAPMPGFMAPHAFADIVAEQTVRAAEEERMGMAVPGMFGRMTEYAIPICLGDYFNEYRVIATTPAFVDEIQLNSATGKKLQLAEGRNFESWNEQHGYFECIVGSIVAKRLNIKLGDRINPSHGAPDGKEHEDGFHVVGILAESRTPADRAVYINMEGFYLMDDHAKPINESMEGAFASEPTGSQAALGLDWGDDAAEDNTAEDGAKSPDLSGDSKTPEHSAATEYSDVIYQEKLPLEQREITAILLRTAGASESMLAEADEEDVAFLQLMSAGNAMQLTSRINEGELEKTLEWTPFRPNLAQKSAQAINPVKEIRTLLDVFVAPVQLVLLLLTLMICVVAGISIMVSIYNSMNERKSEIAIMRALGARRTTVMTIVLLETLMLSLAGGVAGWLIAHGLNVAISPFVEQHTGVAISFFDFAPGVTLPVLERYDVKVSPEFLLIPGLIILSALVGLYPAYTAYRTDVAKALTS